MVQHPLGGYIPRSPQRRPSDPTWSTRTQSTGVITPSRPTLKTPCSGKKSNPRITRLPRAYASPYMTPERARVRDAPGMSSPMELFTPKEIRDNVAKEALRRKEANSTNTPGRARLPVRKSNTLLFPPSLGVRERSSMLVSPPMQGTPRRVERPRDPTGPTVQLLKVLNKCWDDDSVKESDWTLTDGLLNGRNDERDRSAMWNTLGGAVNKVWPELGGWIMCNTPADSDVTWFSSTQIISFNDDEGYISDPHLAEKYSSLDRKGFHMTASTYDAACNVIKDLASSRSSLQRLADGEINPFFVIYACADCGVPLPPNFNRQLLWKHLDATLRAKCWGGLGSARADTQQRHTSANADHVPPKLFRKGEDPDGILTSLLRISCRDKSRFEPAPAPAADYVPRPVHRLQITVKDYKWVARAHVGTVWYQAGDLHDEDDIACFAVIDSLTRLLPYCRGGILEISTGHIHMLWGVGGAPSGAWIVVQDVCMEYQVKLRATWTELRGPDPCERINPAERITVPPRDRDVVNTVARGFEQNQLYGEAYRCMMSHLQQVTALN